MQVPRCVHTLSRVMLPVRGDREGGAVRHPLGIGGGKPKKRESIMCPASSVECWSKWSDAWADCLDSKAHFGTQPK